MDLSIIIVNWNSKDYLRKCILSVSSGTQGLDYEIIVIDSASYDGCAEMLCEEFPEVSFIQSTENSGFAKANNEAFNVSRGGKLLFLNPDTEVEGDAINELFRQLEALPGAGAVGGKLLNSDRTIQDTCIRAFPSILNQMFDSQWLKDRFRTSSLWGNAPIYSVGRDAAPIDAISGACLMVTREAFEQVGGFSNDYFMYSEDIDLCFELKKAGYKLFYVPGAIVVHHGGGSSAKSEVSEFSEVMMVESRCRFFRKHKSHLYSSLYRVIIAATSMLRLYLSLLLWPINYLNGKSASSHFTLRKWLSRLRWSLGLERWTTDY